jgi:predicted component of type VI protein secretion system
MRMITLRLFRSSDPFHEIEARSLLEGEISLGRDPSTDWTIADPRADLSRRHCVLRLDKGRVSLRDSSTNGVFIGAERRRARPGLEEALQSGEILRLGSFILVVDAESEASLERAVAPAETLTKPQRPEPETPEKSCADAGGPVGVGLPDATLIEAFCRGAGVDASAFAGEDPSALLERLGSFYRQTLEDLSSLMNDRAMMRASLAVEQTTISARDNNPLKWAPPHRLAIDLLRGGERGFLSGGAAVKASFADLRRHAVALIVGHQAAVRCVLEELSPIVLAAAARKGQLPFGSKYEGSWRAYELRHADLRAGLDSAGAGFVGSAFRQGYEASLATLTEGEEAA